MGTKVWRSVQRGRSTGRTRGRRARRAAGLIASVLVLLVWLALPTAALAQTPPAATVITLAERLVTQLPAGPLAWRLETLPTAQAALAATATTGVAAEHGGRFYLLTLAASGGRTPGATVLAETGPVPAPRGAAQYLLRLSLLTGGPGSQTAVHAHPGAEADYVLAGDFAARTDAGAVRVPVGRVIVGPPAGGAHQAVNLGTTDLQVLVFYAVDAAQPFSSPAAFADPSRAAQLAPFPSGLGLPRTGGGGLPVGLPVALGAISALSAGLFLRRRAER